MSPKLSLLTAQTMTFLLLQNRLVDSQDNDVQPGACTTLGCHDAARRLRESIDFNEDPCQNPYQYVCGNWLKNHPMHPIVQVVDQFSGIRKQLKWQMKHALKKSRHIPGNSQTIMFLKHMYDKCMNTNERNAAGSAPIQDLFTRFDEFLIPHRIDRISELTRIASLASTFLGRKGLIELRFSDHEPMLPQIEKSSLIMADHQFYLNEVFHQDKIVVYKSTLFAYFNLTFPTRYINVDARTKLHRLIDNIFQFEKSLAEIQDKSKNEDDQLTTVNMNDLKRNFSSIDWWQFFNDVFGARVFRLLYRDKQSFDSASIMIYPEYMQRLHDCLSSLNSSTLVSAWVSASIIHKFAPFLDDHFKSSYQNLSMSDTIKYDEDQQDTCFEQLNQTMPIAVQALYAKTYLEDRVVKDVESMFPNFVRAFNDTIYQSSWLDNLTKRNLIRKSNSMTMIVGAQSVHLDDIELDSYYNNTNLAFRGEYMDMIGTAKFGEMIRLDYLNFVKRNIVENPLKESFYYRPAHNRIVIPALLLQYPFYNYHWPTHVKYSILGSIIGHEFIHGFNRIERLRELISISSRWTFNTKFVCFTQSYSSIILKQLRIRVNVVQTEGENIADAEGLRLSMKAYSIYANKTGQVSNALPGLNLTTDQINAVGSLLWMCGYESWHLTRKSWKVPFRVRLSCAVKDTEAFFNAFACPINSAANPGSACKIW